MDPMTAPDAAELAARRIDTLLADLRDSPDPRAGTVAEELTQCLVHLYGAGLARIAELLGPERVADLCADPLVESLLLVHDLHPVPADVRIRRALGDDVEVAGVDEAGVARVRLRAGGPRCRGAQQAVRGEIEAAVRGAAPEVTAVEIEIPPSLPPLLQVSRRPVAAGRDGR